MESQDNNIQFSGTPQSESTASPFPTPKDKGGKTWKLISIISLVLVVGLAAGFTFFLLQAQKDGDKISDLEGRLSTANTELNKFREVTGAQSADDVAMNMDFSAFFDAMAEADVSTENLVLSVSKDWSIKLSEDGDYEIAIFGANDVTLEGGWTAVFYRSLPDGDWKYSINFSGHQEPFCSELSEDELAAFDGIITCAVEEEAEEE
jgi:hypothetical protein